MAETANEKLARAQKLYKAQQIYAQKNPNGDPGTQAMGFPDGETTAAEEQQPTSYLERGKQGLGAVAKGLDVARGAITAPALAALLKATTGKDVASLKDWGNAVNPTNLKTFPSSSEMYERAGVPEGAKMSDYVGGYGEPGKSPWYQPEKGGMLDFTLRGAGGLGTDVAIDPLTYLSFGGSAAAKTAIKEGVSRAVLEQAAKQGEKGIVKKALSMGGEAASKIPGVQTAKDLGQTVNEGAASLYNKLRESKLGKIATDVATAPSDAVSSIGKKIYEAPLTPVTHEGMKYGKSELGQTFYNAGIKSPVGLRAQADDAINSLMKARNDIFNQAAEAGGKVNMERALQKAKDTAAEIRQAGVPGEQKMADFLESEIAKHENMVKGTEAIPDQVVKEPTGTLDWKGDQVMRDKVIPGSPAVPPKVLPPGMASRIKTAIYKSTPDSAFNEFVKTAGHGEAQNILSSGFRDEAQRATAEALGPKAGLDVAELDKEAGKFIGTKRSQAAVQRYHERLANNAMSLRGTDKVLTALGGLPSLALNKAGDVYLTNQMRLGYGLRKLMENQGAKTGLDVYSRNKIKQYLGYGSEKPGGDNGEEK